MTGRPFSGAALGAPQDATALHVETHRQSVVVTVAHVDLAVEQDHAAVMVLQRLGRVIVNLFGLKRLARLIADDLQQG